MGPEWKPHPASKLETQPKKQDKFGKFSLLSKPETLQKLDADVWSW